MDGRPGRGFEWFRVDLDAVLRFDQGVAMGQTGKRNRNWECGGQRAEM